MASWKWIEDGKTVEIVTDQNEMLRFVGAKIKESEWLGFYDKIADEGEIHAILKTAKRAFLAGGADYAAARVNLRHLIQEFNDSQAAIHEIAKDIGVFFTPTDLVKAFGRNRAQLVEFVLEFTARTYVRGVNGS